MSSRTEKDFLGSKEIPIDAYYGVHTARAMDNFTVTGVQISHFPRFIIALAMVKKASVAANLEFNLLPANKAQAIDQACDEIIDGKLHVTQLFTNSFGLISGAERYLGTAGPGHGQIL